jgi:hypothetical protein
VTDIEAAMDAEAGAGRCTRTPDPLQLPDGTTKPQVVYEYPDGTLVRVKPQGDAFTNDPMYSVEVENTGVTHATGQQDVAFKVDAEGRPVPKGPDDIANPYDRWRNPAQWNAYQNEVLGAGHQQAAP